MKLDNKKKMAIMQIFYDFFLDTFYDLRIGERNYLASPTKPPFVKSSVSIILHLR